MLELWRAGKDVELQAREKMLRISMILGGITKGQLIKALFRLTGDFQASAEFVNRWAPAQAA
jgi:hypothetical protein